MKKSQYRTVVKANKWQNQKRGSKLKKQRPSELRILVNQKCSLPLELSKPLPN